MPITSMDHFTVLTADLELSLTFYVDVLGLHLGSRPPLGFPGAWLYAGKQPVLHIIAGRPLPMEPRGVLDHMAFSAQDLPAIVARLDQEHIDYDLRRQPVSGILQLFVNDPNGARVELDFPADETVPDPALLGA